MLLCAVALVATRVGPARASAIACTRQVLGLVSRISVLAGVDGAALRALRAFLSHLSALLLLSLLSLPSVFKDTVVGREKDHNTRATGA